MNGLLDQTIEGRGAGGRTAAQRSFARGMAFALPLAALFWATIAWIA